MQQQAKNHYEVLGISQNASSDEIKQAYHRLALQYHPDRNPNGEKLFKDVRTAYSFLEDPEKRKKYDRDLFLSQLGARTDAAALQTNLYRSYGDVEQAQKWSAEYNALKAQHDAAKRKAEAEDQAAETAKKRAQEEDDRRYAALRALTETLRQRHKALRTAVHEYEEAVDVYAAKFAAVPDLTELLAQIKRQQDTHLRELDRMQAQQRQWAAAIGGGGSAPAPSVGLGIPRSNTTMGASGSVEAGSAGSLRRVATAGRIPPAVRR